MNNKQVENLIYEYHWRKKELDRIGSILWGGRDRGGPSMGLVAQYGLEATLPHSNTSIKSPAEMKDMDLREQRLYKRWKEYREIVIGIELFGDYIEDEYQLIILDCMMEGMSYRAIAAHIGMNRNKVRDLKDDMISQLCQKCQFLLDLIDKKTA